MESFHFGGLPLGAECKWLLIPILSSFRSLLFLDRRLHLTIPRASKTGQKCIIKPLLKSHVPTQCHSQKALVNTHPTPKSLYPLPVHQLTAPLSATSRYNSHTSDQPHSYYHHHPTSTIPPDYPQRAPHSSLVCVPSC